MRSKLLIALLLFAGQQTGFGAKSRKAFDGEALFESQQQHNQRAYQQIAAKVKLFSVFNITASAIANHLNSAYGMQEIQLNLGQRNWNLSLKEYNPLSSDFRLRTSTRGEIKLLDSFKTGIYNGYANGSDKNRVNLAIRENYIAGSVIIDGIKYIIEPANNFDPQKPFDVNEFVVYKENDHVLEYVASCDNKTVSMKKVSREEQLKLMKQLNVDRLKAADKGNQRIVSGNIAVCADIAIAADFEMYDQHGSDVQKVTGKIVELLSRTQEIWDGQEVTFVLSEVFIEDSETGLFGVNGESMGNRLAKFSAWAPGNFGDYDLAEAWLGRKPVSGTVGVANYRTVCNRGRAHGVIGYMVESGNDRRSVYTFAHETGHIWGCPHYDEGDNVMVTLNSPNNTRWSQSCLNDVAGFVNELSCIEKGCTGSPVTPQAQFEANVTNGCSSSLMVQFYDRSWFKPTSWLWDFGDGQTSSEQNPTHTYNEANVYTVKLTVANAAGNHEEIKSQYITVGQGDQYSTANGGAGDNSIGGGGNFNDNDARGLFFNANTDITIESFFFYAASAGERTIHVLKDAAMTGENGEVEGELFLSRAVQIPSGNNRVEVNLEIPAGDEYFIKISGTLVDLFRNENGANFHYNITDNSGNNLVDITQSNAGPNALNYYYYFYDWAVRKNGCTPTSSIGEQEGIAWQVFPNPANDQINLIVSDAMIGKELELFEIKGSKVLAQRVTQLNTNLDVSQLPKGVYILKVGVGIQKLVLK